jgi:hypothetical protein
VVAREAAIQVTRLAAARPDVVIPAREVSRLAVVEDQDTPEAARPSVVAVLRPVAARSPMVAGSPVVAAHTKLAAEGVVAASAPARQSAERRE